MTRIVKILTAVLPLSILALFAAQVDAPPVPIPFTAEPAEIEWRIGFDLGNFSVIETPELNPQHNVQLATREADRSLGDAPFGFGIGLLPFAKVLSDPDRLVNPRQWTIINLKGMVRKASFRAVGVFIGTAMSSEQGGYHLVSIDPMPSNPFIGFRREPSSSNLIFAFAGKLKSKPEIRLPVSETRWRNLKPTEDPEHLPPDYQTAGQVLSRTGARGVVFGNSIEAMVDGAPQTLWLLNYGEGDPSKGQHPWGIFKYVDDDGVLQPLYLFKPGNTDYITSLAAAIDLDQDGTDELIVQEDYRNGTAFEVLSASGNGYERVYHSYFRGVH